MPEDSGTVPNAMGSHAMRESFSAEIASGSGPALRDRSPAIDRPIAAVLLGGAVTLAAWWVGEQPAVSFVRQAAGVQVWQSATLLLFGLALASTSTRRNGLRIGEIRPHWKRVLLVCSIPVVLTALVYPRLPVRPFAGATAGMWLVSPAGQDLVFAGFLYGTFTRLVPGRIHPMFPLDRALLLSALCFSAWHLQNFFGAMPSEFVLFQLAYTFLGFLLTGLSRQWTGSILYVTLSHSAVNWIVWVTG